MQKESLMTDRPNLIIFVKNDAHFFYTSNFSRQDDVGNHSFFEHWQYFLFPSLSCCGLGYTTHSIGIPVAETKMNSRYIIMRKPE